MYLSALVNGPELSSKCCEVTGEDIEPRVTDPSLYS